MPNVYKVQINKHTSKKKLKTVRVIASNIIQAAHIAAENVYGDIAFKNECIEIVGIKKCIKSKNIVGLDDLFDDGDEEGDMNAEMQERMGDPYNTTGEAPDNLLIFKHDCGNTLQLRDNGWVVIACTSCRKLIKREEITNISGIWCFIPSKK